MSTIDLRLGNVLDVLKAMPDESVNCCVTSPPYWGLRSYGTEPQIWLGDRELCQEHQWDNAKVVCKTAGLANAIAYESNRWVTGSHQTCSLCGAWRGELGLEPTPEMYVDHIVQIFGEVRRVLRDDGTLWLNLGDSYMGSGGAGGWSENRNGARENPNKNHPTIKPKDLVGIPWMVAFALRADGWYLRSEIIWHKPNPMPESVTDRPTKAHEQIFLLAKSAKYYYDADAVREPHIEKHLSRYHYDFWKEGTKEALGGGRPNGASNTSGIKAPNPVGRNRRTVWTVTTQSYRGAHFATFPPKLIEPCILAGCPVGGTVLDPFNGAGTTALVAVKYRRDYIGIDLKQEYLDMTRERLAQVQLSADI